MALFVACFRVQDITDRASVRSLTLRHGGQRPGLVVGWFSAHLRQPSRHATWREQDLPELVVTRTE